MEIDKISYNDLSLFSSEEEFSVFHKLNFARTVGGKEWLRKLFSEPLNSLDKIRTTQQILQLIIQKEKDWPLDISNGTIMVIEKFYESNIDAVPENPNALSAFTYKLFHSPDYSLVKYTVSHFADFTRGFSRIFGFFADMSLPPQLKLYIDRAKGLLQPAIIQRLMALEPKAKLSPAQSLEFGHFLLYRFKDPALELVNIFSLLDAYYSMAVAVQRFNLSFPQFIEADTPDINAKGLYHILLQQPVSYDVEMNRESNFLFLTGANMAGKSTFIKAVGTAVFLAHIGMGVPATEMRLTLFDGLLSNIQVSDNIMRGESYFFNEVQRIKNTIIKINDGRKWLVLIDELFKGTNVEDAMKCSTTVIEGLIRITNSLFILSTHLYEIGEGLKKYPNISFKYFETTVAEDQLYFSYQLKNGISNDRLGYLILKREKVVEMLEKL
jgi:DNA mismatch repair protein MutS